MFTLRPVPVIPLGTASSKGPCIACASSRTSTNGGIWIRAGRKLPAAKIRAAIVVSEVLGMWVKLAVDRRCAPVVGKWPSIAGFLRMLRLAPLARLLKLVRVFLESDLSWTEGPKL